MIKDHDLVQHYRDTGCVRSRDRLIQNHLVLVRKLASKYITSHHGRDDLIEVGYFNLVKGVELAKDNLRDNNLTPYLIRYIKYHLLRYVAYDHVSIIPTTVAGNGSIINMRKPARLSIDTDLYYEGIFDHRESDSCIKTSLKEIFNKHIKNDRQRRIVDMRLAGHDFTEIANEMNIDRRTVSRNWYSFQTQVRNHYAEEVL